MFGFVRLSVCLSVCPSVRPAGFFPKFFLLQNCSKLTRNGAKLLQTEKNLTNYSPNLMKFVTPMAPRPHWHRRIRPSVRPSGGFCPKNGQNSPKMCQKWTKNDQKLTTRVKNSPYLELDCNKLVLYSHRCLVLCVCPSVRPSVRRVFFQNFFAPKLLRTDEKWSETVPN